VHTQTSIEQLKAALQDFHANKHFITEAEAWRTKTGLRTDFNIPKLELFQSFATAIQTVGSLIQHTADVSEQLLITHCKHTFEWTSCNRDSFMEQIVRLLDCEERMRLFNLYAMIRSHDISLINPATDLEQSHGMYVNPTLAWIQEVLPSEQMHLMGQPRPIRNHFLKGILREDSRAAFNLTVKPDSLRHTIQHLGSMYKLHTLPSFYESYVARSVLTLPNVSQSQLTFYNALRFQVWKKFRLQLLSAFNNCTIMPSHLIQAYPPSDDFPLGYADAILFSPQVLEYGISTGKHSSSFNRFTFFIS